MNNYFSLTRVIIISIIFSSCVNKSFIRQGIVSHYTHFINIKDSSKLPYVLSYLESKIWFKDSCVIYEMKVINGHTNHTANGPVSKNSHELFKYTYLDLRTFKCQDYYNLSDTAKPFCNYLLNKDTEALSWNFYSKNKIENADSLINMPDTIMQNKSYKRYKLLRIFKEFSDEKIFFMDCKTKRSIFHLSKELDNKYPNCQVTRIDIRADLLNNPLTEIMEMNFIKESLTTDERKMFAQWAKNAIETKLPLISGDEKYKRCNFDIMQKRGL